LEKTKIGQPVPQLPVEDVEKAQIYYKDILGFEIKDVERESGYLGKINGFVRPKLDWEENHT